jgi:phosphotransferase system, enzyme I, PtsP
VRSGLTAEAAVQKVQDDNRARMNQISDPYLRERLLDLEDLANRLLQHVAGEVSTAGTDLPDEVILIARSMGPAELLDYDRRRLRGLILEEGSPTAHVAIVARALDIPVIGRVKDVLAKVEAGDVVVADGDNAQVFLRPGDDILQAIEANLQMRRARKETYAAIRSAPAETLDGTRIALHLNAGLQIDLPHLDDTGAEGIGLYRTEIPFMVRDRFPEVDEQADIYRRILDQAGDRPVTFRTLDIGGDKVLPYLPESEEENPAMGWRAIRIALDRPAMLRQQLRALLRAAAGRHLRVMFPMVAEVAEFVAARAVLGVELRRAEARCLPLPDKIQIGVMLEVPSLLWQLAALLPEVDFVSVGSNDLMQFLFACDRGNPTLAGRYDPLSPAMLSLLAELVRQCARHNVPLSLCGEMAGSPLEAMALLGVGFRNLSMAPASFGPVKAMVRSLTLAPLEQFVAMQISSPDRSLRSKMSGFAHDHGVAI